MKPPKPNVKTTIIENQRDAMLFVLHQSPELIKHIRPADPEMDSVFCAGRCKDAEKWFVIERNLPENRWVVMVIEGEPGEVARYINGFLNFTRDDCEKTTEVRLISIDGNKPSDN